MKYLNYVMAYAWLFMSFANFTTAAMNWQLNNFGWLIFNVITAIVCIFIFARIISDIGQTNVSNDRARNTKNDSTDSSRS